MGLNIALEEHNTDHMWNQLVITIVRKHILLEK